MSLKNKLIDEIFYDHKCDIDDHPEDFHAMTNEHEEVLG